MYFIKYAKSILVALIVLSALPFVVHAAPSVQSVTGTFTHGTNVIVGGTGFGAKSPVAPAFWDTVSYSGLNNGNVAPVGGSNPWSGYCSDVNVYYKTSNPRGKWTAHYSNQWSTDGAKKGALDGAVVAGASTAGKLYVTWWNYVGSDPAPAGNASNKWVRLVSADWGTVNEGTIIWEPTQFHSYGFTSGFLPGNHWGDWSGSYPAWNRMEMFIDSTVANSPQYTGWINGASTGVFDSTPSQSWRIYRLDCLGFDGSNTDASLQPTVDWGEIYADNTLARVESCAGSSWSSRGHCEIQIPNTTWNNSQLQVQVNQGSFADASTAYLYVIDASGTPNEIGTVIQFGYSSPVIAPPAAPSGLSVN